jgi:hypothetical protein
MNIVRLTAASTLALTLHMQAQVPTPTPPPSPTMAQTVAFINDALNQHGHFTEVFPPDFIAISDVLEFQSLSQAGPCDLEYEKKGVLSMRDPDGNPKAPMQYKNVQKLSLTMEDPRGISVVPTQVGTPLWTIKLKVDDNQSLFTDGHLVHSSPHEMKLAILPNKDLAERVAKAYIRAMVLCHKPEAPSLF